MNNFRINYLGWPIIAVVSAVAMCAVLLSYSTHHLHEVRSNDIAKSSLFTRPLALNGVPVDRLGFTSFSPSGRYFMFIGFREDSDPQINNNTAYVVDLITDRIVQLPGVPQRGFIDDTALEILTPGGIEIYDVATGETIASASSILIDRVSISPNKDRIAMMGGDGATIYSRSTGGQVQISNNGFGAADAWMSDNRHVVGYRGNGVNLYEAGQGRELGIWDADTGEFSPLGVNLQPASLRSVQWLVSNRVVRVNAGYDDGSYDFLVDIKTGKVVTIGDTSHALLGGLDVDNQIGRFLVVGQGGDTCNFNVCEIAMYSADGTVLRNTQPPGYVREQGHIIDSHRVVFLRRPINQNGIPSTSGSIVVFDFDTNMATPIMQINESGFVSLAITPDHRGIVVGQGNRLEYRDLPK